MALWTIQFCFSLGVGAVDRERERMLLLRPLAVTDFKKFGPDLISCIIIPFIL